MLQIREAQLPVSSSATGGVPPEMNRGHVTIIEPRTGWRLVDWKELIEYRDLLTFLTWRSIKVQYAQSALGIGWAVIPPVFSMLVFTVVFGRLAGIESEGVPYAIFTYVALVPWFYFSNALVDGTNSLVNNANMLSKVYFPRLILPLAAVLAKLLDFMIAMVLVAGLMAWFRIMPTWNIVVVPLLVLLMMLTAGGMGVWLASLAIQFRDVKYAMTFVVQLLMYAAPVVYPASLIPTRWRWVYAINPMVGVIEGFRAALLGARSIPWDLIAIGALSSMTIAVSGILYFRARERIFADVA